QLGFSVRIGGSLGRLFGDRQAVRGPKGCTGGTENQFLYANPDRAFEQLDAVADIVAKVFSRVGHRFADQGKGCKMEDGLGSSLRQGLAQMVVLLGEAQDKVGARVYCRTVSLGQVIINGNLVSGIEQ